jgi:hypothetical protein
MADNINQAQNEMGEMVREMRNNLPTKTGIWADAKFMEFIIVVFQAARMFATKYGDQLKQIKTKK